MSEFDSVKRNVQNRQLAEALYKIIFWIKQYSKEEAVEQILEIIEEIRKK